MAKSKPAHKPKSTPRARNRDWRGFCGRCGVALTETDWQAEYCTNCKWRLRK